MADKTRVVKFRAWQKAHKKMHYKVNLYSMRRHEMTKAQLDNKSLMDSIGLSCEVMQFTGLVDKNGKEIWEGDILKVRKPYRTSQVHVGNNIPTGRYEEPLEPAISEYFEAVSFNAGAFVVGEVSQGNLLCWALIDWDASGAMDGFRSDSRCWGGPEGDLQYLLDEYGFSSEEDLVKSLGAEVIGNIWENPELLTPKI